MTNISWVPLIGDFVADIQERIEQTTDW
jgi:hypothetical protein